MQKQFVKLLILSFLWCLLAGTTFAFSRQDSLRGGNGSGRRWWNVVHYDLSVSFDTAALAIHGSNIITARIISHPGDSLQLDLQELMFLDSVVMDGNPLSFIKEGNVWWILHPFHMLDTGDLLQFTAYYHGKPKIANNPPWSGGFIDTTDELGNPWKAVACQGLGASSWWPCKDDQRDEPDSGMTLRFLYTGNGQVISNGRPVATSSSDLLYIKKVSEWKVKNPINTYNATFYKGDYVCWSDTLNGEKGVLNLDFCVLAPHEQKARKHFAMVKPMLHCFEHWMGPFPFYEDGYKLVEAPYAGMEHQSAIAYGNQFENGYLHNDRSGTGIGLLFDFIIVHESGHEWFGNNITAADIADNWLHEGFTTYAEALFVECAYGKEQAGRYTRGEWKNIRNNRPVIGSYGVHNEGSSDEYDKGSAVVHMIRTIMDNDEKFRQLLRALNEHYYHQTVSSKEVEAFISAFADYDFSTLFDQYLRTTDIPQLEWYIKKKQLYFRFVNCIQQFTLPLTVSAENEKKVLYPSTNWQHVKWKYGYNLQWSPDFLIRLP